MPSRPVIKKPYKRRYRRRRRFRKRYPRLVSMGAPSGLPTTRIANLRYSDVKTFTTTSGVLQSTLFRCGSIFDPDLTGVGHQPMGHDTWESMYNHYCVLGAKIRCVWSNDSGSQHNMAGCFVTDSTTIPYTAFENIIEARKGRYLALTGQRNQQTSLTKYSAKKFFNVANMKDNFTRLGATMGVSPTDDAYFWLWCQPLDKTSTNIVRVAVIIDYIVLFSEPKDMAVS